MNSSTMSKALSTLSTDNEGPGWREIQEQQGWDNFLAWCREQENTPHE